MLLKYLVKKSKMAYDCGYAGTNFHWNGLGFYIVGAHFQSHHTGFCVEWFLLVEDKVAHAVVYLLAMKILDGLQRVGVMTYQYVGAGAYQLVGIPTLTAHWLQRVFAAPV